jgi:predicted amidohydrolase YtcJ
MKITTATARERKEKASLNATVRVQCAQTDTSANLAMKKILTLLVALSGLTFAASAETTSLQEFAGGLVSLPQMTIYPAKEIITLDPAKPKAEAIAVVGDRILAVGSLDELKKAAGNQPFAIDRSFAKHVIVPGFIGQHDHPLLAALTMIAEIISIEDWVLPSGTVPAAKNREEYLKRLADANGTLEDPEAVLLTWGFHQYFHGTLTCADLDKISATRSIIVWHRSAHEFILNGAAMKKFGVTREWHDKLSNSQKEQSNFEEGHYWEQGAFAVMPLIAPAIATPARLRQGLEFVEEYFHANGITRGCEPGGLASKPLQEAQNAVLSDPATPFRFYFIADGKSITGTQPDEKVIPETEKLLSWGQGNTAYLPKQVKLFADGAIFSQAMQVRDPYSDGHQGEWMMDLDFFKRSFRIYWDAGYQIHCHVNGDAGLDMVLNTLEENLRRHPRIDHRTVIVHFAVSQPDQVERIKGLGAIVSGNPYYTTALADNYSKVGLGPERADQMVRMGDVERAGISYSYHSDMPMAPGQPLFLMHCGVNRITQSGRIAGENQRVSREGALRAVTLEAAYSLHMENEVGSIVPGKLANLTVLADNPVTCDAAKIKDIVVWGTMHEGRVQPVKPAKDKKTAGVRLPDNFQPASALHISGSGVSVANRPASPVASVQDMPKFLRNGLIAQEQITCGHPGCSCSAGHSLAALFFPPAH